MKILIIAHARSGSTNFMMKLGRVLNINHQVEPFNKRLHTVLPIVDLSTDIIVKTLADQTPDDNNPIEFYTEYMKKFDKIILLLRKNKKETMESLVNARATNKWHHKGMFDGIEIPYEVKYWYNFTTNIINTLSDNLNIPITYYEDLYSGDIEIFTKEMKKIGLETETEELFPYFNPINRYRKFTKRLI
jgi:hypothetical protein